MAFFDTWAKHIASGDWWGDEVLHPFHDWHDDFAAEYFRQFPHIESKYTAMAGDSLNITNAKIALINDIYKGKTFHQEPLYPYLLAITYKIFGADVTWVYFWQFILAAFTSVLVYTAGKQIFGDTVGLLGALFVTLCGSIMVFEMVLLRTTITNFFTILLLYLFIRVMERPHWKIYLLFGISCGLALLTQSYFVLFIVPAVIWLIWSHRHAPQTGSKYIAAYAGGLLLIMSPLFIRNIRADVSMSAMASHGAMAYIPMNIQRSFPMESFYVHMPSLVKIRHESGGKMIPAVLASLETFDNFNSFWKLYRQKIGGLFMWYEIPNNMNYYLYREMVPVLKMIPVRYFFIAPLGIAGLLIGLWRYRWRLMPTLLMTIVCILPLLIAGNLARYRTPLVIMMCLFAAYFIIEIISNVQQRKWKIVSIGTVIVLLAFLYTSTIVDKLQFIYQGSDFDTFYRYHYMDKLVEYEDAGDYQRYLALTTDMMNNIPEYFLKVPAGQMIRKSNEAESTRHIANFMESHYNILTFLKKEKEASFYRERIATLRKRIEEFNIRAGLQ